MIEAIKLGEIGNFISGGTPSRKHPEYFEGTIPWVSTPALNGGLLDESDAVQLITEDAIANSATKLLPSRSLLIGVRVGVGKTAVNSVPMCTNQDIVAITGVDETLWDIRYVSYAVQAKSAYLVSQKQGATITGITSKLLKNLEIKRLSLEAQRRCISNLDSVKEKIIDCEKQLEMFDDLVKSRFVEMFGDPAANTYGLSVQRLSNLGVLERGKSKHRPRNAPELRGGPNGPYPLVQTGDVTNAGLYLDSYEDTYTELGLQQSKMWPKGTLCITIAANIAQTSILAIDACFPDSVVGFTPGEAITNVFLHYWFSFFQGILEEQAPQAAQKNINLKILSELSVITPPIEQQREFAAFVQQVDKLKFETQRAIDKLQMLYDSLAQEYFGGE